MFSGITRNTVCRSLPEALPNVVFFQQPLLAPLIPFLYGGVPFEPRILKTWMLEAAVMYSR